MSEPDILRAPSAITTAGGGFEFENRVGAWLASALVAGTSPVGQPGAPRMIGFQEKALGQVLDDIAVTAADGVTRWLASIKTYDLLTASKLNEEFVGEAWLQLLSENFDLGRDFVGFVSGTAAERNWQSLLRLIEEARTNPPDRLAARIAAPEHFDETARTLWESARCPERLQSRLPVSADAAPGLLLSRLTPCDSTCCGLMARLANRPGSGVKPRWPPARPIGPMIFGTRCSDWSQARGRAREPSTGA